MIKLVLLSVCAALTAVLVLQWRDWPPPLPTPSADPGVDGAEVLTTDTQSPAVPTMPPPEHYAVIAERPLFLAGRRPIEEEPPEPEEEPEEEEVADLAQLDVTAILVLSPDNASVWLKEPGTPDLVRLRPGDAFKGWQVAEILPDQVLMERQGRREALDLLDFSRPNADSGRRGRMPGLPPNRPLRPPR